MKDDATLVRAEDLGLGYGRRRVLSGVNWTVRAGEYWFVLGPNGEGKSTLLRALLGLLDPLAGRLDWSGDLAGRRRVAFVPQRCDLNPTLPTTVREFVAQGFVGLRLPAGDRERRLGEALDRVGLGGQALRSYWALSGGQRQRAVVARALVREPRLLILDEPTNGLDLTSEDQLMEALARLRRAHGLTLILVTHDLAMAARHASHVALVHAGAVQVGTRDEVLTTARLRAAYAVPVEVRKDAAGRVAVALGGEGGA